MQETIIALCLTLAAAYLGYTFYKKIRDKNSGCCGCNSECCSKKHSPCASGTPPEIQAFSRPNSPQANNPAGGGAKKSV